MWKDKKPRIANFALKCGLCIVIFFQRVQYDMGEKKRNFTVTNPDKHHFKPGHQLTSISVISVIECNIDMM